MSALRAPARDGVLDRWVQRGELLLDEVLREAGEHRGLMRDGAAHDLRVAQDKVQGDEPPAAASEHDSRRMTRGPQQPGGVVRLLLDRGPRPPRGSRAA